MKSILQLTLFLLACTAMVASAQRTEVKIKPTDIISIRISGVPADDIADISQNYNVANDGKFPLPHIGRITAAGLTPSQLGIRIEQAYKTAEIFTRPTIVVSTSAIEERNKVDVIQQVTVNGEVRNPRRAPYTTGMTLLDAIADAGGFTDWAARDRVRLIRDGKTTEHDVRKISANPSLDVVLKPNDKIIVIHR